MLEQVTVAAVVIGLVGAGAFRVTVARGHRLPLASRSGDTLDRLLTVVTGLAALLAVGWVATRSVFELSAGVLPISLPLLVAVATLFVVGAWYLRTLQSIRETLAVDVGPPESGVLGRLRSFDRGLLCWRLIVDRRFPAVRRGVVLFPVLAGANLLAGNPPALAVALVGFAAFLGINRLSHGDPDHVLSRGLQDAGVIDGQSSNRSP